MLIVHGTFHLDSGCLNLWGETDTLGVRKAGRRLKTSPHPFAAASSQLEAWLADLAPHSHPEAQTFQLRLPGSQHQPQPSPEMRATGAFPDDTFPTELHLWQVEGITLSIHDALDLLLALAQRNDVARSLYFWRAAALEALALVAGQQVIPALERDGFRYRAFWQSLPEQPERLTELAAQMPPICRALTETETSPYKLLQAFVGEVVDSTIRESAISLKLPSGRGTGAAWLSALTTDDPQLKLPTAEAESLFNAWQIWVGQTDAAGNSAFRIAFRLDAPDDETTQTWRLSYLLQAADDPSLIVSASQIWRGDRDHYLQHRFDQPQERLLRGLAFAGRLFAPILDSLRSAAPSNAAFDTGQAYSFLQEAAPLFCRQVAFASCCRAGGAAKEPD